MKKILSLICMAVLLMSAGSAVAGDTANQTLGFNVSNLAQLTLSSSSLGWDINSIAIARTGETKTMTYGIFNNGANKKISIVNDAGMSGCTEGTLLLNACWSYSTQGEYCTDQVQLGAPAGGAVSAGWVTPDCVLSKNLVTGVTKMDVSGLTLSHKVRLTTMESASLSQAGGGAYVLTIADE